MSNLDKIISAIQGGKRFLVTAHENPDGDALGSTLALGLALKKLGKDTTFYNKDGVPDYLEFLHGSEEVTKSLNDAGQFDVTFIVDCTDTGRAGADFEKFKSTGRCGTSIIIDHHETNKPSADIHLLDPHASSTGMIIYSVLKKLSIEICPDIATNLYTTIMSDTGSFKYSNTYPETFKMAAELVELGADPALISQAIYESEPLARLKLLGLVLPTLEMSYDGRMGSVTITRAMFKETGTSKEDTEGFVNFPRCIKGVEVAILFREEPPDDNGLRWKISLRAKGTVNVAKIAEKFSGGGHRNAAGCTIPGNLQEVKQKVVQAVDEALRQGN